jgi:flavin-dependent dehydrogenase
LQLTSEKGESVQSKLQTGGFGISRYKLDYELTRLFNDLGITFHSKTPVTAVKQKEILFNDSSVTCTLIVGAHGKYSPKYIKKAKPKSDKNYIGIKYHVKGNLPNDLVSLHSFSGGYCGTNQIEDNLHCICYLVDAEQLKQCNNDIPKLEKEVMFKNKNIKQLFESVQFQWEKPAVISNVKFDKQGLYNNHMLFIGDAAGAISPLSGNGMSMAARSANILSELMSQESDFQQLCINYEKRWDEANNNRVGFAKVINKIMLHPTSHHLILKLLKLVPAIRKKVVNAMQGEKIVRNS